MKKSLVYLSLTTTCFVTAVHAQGSNPVTLYGRINVSYEQSRDNGKSTGRVVNNASYLGVRGREDLGGGLSAEFQIESGVAVDDGTSGTLASRDSWVGIVGGFGTLRLGRITSPLYYATVDRVSMHNHDAGTSADRLFNLAAHGSLRNSNSLYYKSPSLGPLNIELQHAFLTETGKNGDRASNITVSYNGGPLYVGGGYATSKRLQGNLVNPTLVTTKDSAFLLSSVYDAQFIKVGALFERSKRQLNDASDTANYWRLSAMVPVGNGELHANYGKAGGFGHSISQIVPIYANDRKQYTLGYVHNLSKRTSLYGLGTKVDDLAKSHSFGLGMRHNF